MDKLDKLFDDIKFQVNNESKNIENQKYASIQSK